MEKEIKMPDDEARISSSSVDCYCEEGGVCECPPKDEDDEGDA